MFAYCPKNKIFGIFFLFFLSFVFYLFSFSPVSAQGLDFGVATTYKLDDKNLENGDILSISPGKNILERSSTNYDEKMFGVSCGHPLVRVLFSLLFFGEFFSKLVRKVSDFFPCRVHYSLFMLTVNISSRV